jgi:hypothetical protein
MNDKNAIIAEYIRHSFQTESSDPMGWVFAGQVKLLCHIRPAHNRITVHGQRSAMEHEQFDGGYDVNWQRDVQRSWYCVLAQHDRSLYKLYETDHDEKRGMARGHINGLILEIAQDNPRIFRRIGCFTHPWIAEGSKSMPEYPEFADVVDPQSLEREEITII